MVDKILAALSLALLVSFLGVVVVFVREVDLTIVISLGIGLATYDLWTSTRTPDDATQEKKS